MFSIKRQDWCSSTHLGLAASAGRRGCGAASKPPILLILPSPSSHSHSSHPLGSPISSHPLKLPNQQLPRNVLLSHCQLALPLKFYFFSVSPHFFPPPPVTASWCSWNIHQIWGGGSRSYMPCRLTISCWAVFIFIVAIISDKAKCEEQDVRSGMWANPELGDAIMSLTSRWDLLIVMDGWRAMAAQMMQTFKTVCPLFDDIFWAINDTDNDDQPVNMNLCSGSHQQKEYHPSLWSILLHQVIIIVTIIYYPFWHYHDHFCHHHKQHKHHPSLWSILLHQVGIVALTIIVTIRIITIDIIMIIFVIITRIFIILMLRYLMWTSPSTGWPTRTSNQTRSSISSLSESSGERAAIVNKVNTIIKIKIDITIWWQVGACSLADLHTDRFADLPAHKVCPSFWICVIFETSWRYMINTDHD